MYRQVIDPVSHSLGLTAIFAALPLVVLFVMLGALRIKAWIASLVALALSLLVAIVVFSLVRPNSFARHCSPERSA